MPMHIYHTFDIDYHIQCKYTDIHNYYTHKNILYQNMKLHDDKKGEIMI